MKIILQLSLSFWVFCTMLWEGLFWQEEESCWQYLRGNFHTFRFEVRLLLCLPSKLFIKFIENFHSLQVGWKHILVEESFTKPTTSMGSKEGDINLPGFKVRCESEWTVSLILGARLIFSIGCCRSLLDRVVELNGGGEASKARDSKSKADWHRSGLLLSLSFKNFLSCNSILLVKFLLLISHQPFCLYKKFVVLKKNNNTNL